MKLIFILFILIYFTGCSSSEEIKEPEYRTPVKEDILELESHLPATLPESDMERALEIMDIVHFRVPLKETDPDLWNLPLPEAIDLSLNDPEVGHICGGLALTYSALATAAGLRVRSVSLFDRVFPLLNSHATVETLIDGRWIATDPTFNTLLRNPVTGDYIGYLEARETGFTVEQRPVSSPDRTQDNYYISLTDLLTYVWIKIPTDQEGSPRQPTNWNGSYIGPCGPGNIANQNLGLWTSFWEYGLEDIQ